MFLLLSMTFASDWRVLLTQNNTKFKRGDTRVGLWQICFPPSQEGPDGYSAYCCHPFSWLEEFFPVEMKIGQVLIPIALCLAILGLVIFYIAYKWRMRYVQNTRWVFIAAGIFYVTSSMFIFIPVILNIYSVAKNKLISFPASFDLPPTERQDIGHAIINGTISAILLLIGGTFIIGRGLTTPHVFPFFQSELRLPRSQSS